MCVVDHLSEHNGFVENQLWLFSFGITNKGVVEVGEDDECGVDAAGLVGDVYGVLSLWHLTMLTAENIEKQHYNSNDQRPRDHELHL